MPFYGVPGIPNILIQGYDAIEDRIVWGIIEEDLDNLIDDVNRLLS